MDTHSVTYKIHRFHDLMVVEITTVYAIKVFHQ